MAVVSSLAWYVRKKFYSTGPGVDPTKHNCAKFIQPFRKLDYFVVVGNLVTIMKWSRLQKSVLEFTQKVIIIFILKYLTKLKTVDTDNWQARLG